MDQNKSTFDTIMENCPYLKGIIQDKIAEEVGKKDAVIVALQEDLTLAKTRVTNMESVLNELI